MRAYRDLHPATKVLIWLAIIFVVLPAILFFVQRWIGPSVESAAILVLPLYAARSIVIRRRLPHIRHLIPSSWSRQ